MEICPVVFPTISFDQPDPEAEASLKAFIEWALSQSHAPGDRPEASLLLLDLAHTAQKTLLSLQQSRVIDV